MRRWTEPGARLARTRHILALTDDPIEAPLGVRFDPQLGARARKAWTDFSLARKKGTVFSECHVYVHIPFCSAKCAYCMLASRGVAGGGEVRRYVEALCREMRAMAPLVAPLRVASLHLGGGTPSLLSEKQLERVLEELRIHLPGSRACYFSAEFNPHTSTPGKLALLRSQGLDRVSFGVQTLTPQVLAGVNRGYQNEAQVARSVAAARAAGIPAVNLDLLAGLPGETEESFADSVKRCLALGPDSLAVNRFFVENSSLAARGYGADAQSTAEADRQMLLADRIIRRQRPPLERRPLRKAGYGSSYVWADSLPARGLLDEDESRVGAALAFGHGAMSHVPGNCFMSWGVGLDAYLDGFHNGELPPIVAAPLSWRFEKAFYAAETISRGRFRPEAFRRFFGAGVGETFSAELGFLLEQGLLRRDGEGYRKASAKKLSALELFAFLLGKPKQPRPARAPRASLAQHSFIQEELPLSYLSCRIGLASFCAQRRLQPGWR